MAKFCSPMVATIEVFHCMHNSYLHTQHNWGCNEHRRPGRDLARSRVWYVRWLKFSIVLLIAVQNLIITGDCRIFASSKAKSSNQALLTDYCVQGHSIIVSHSIRQKELFFSFFFFCFLIQRFCNPQYIYIIGVGSRGVRGAVAPLDF